MQPASLPARFGARVTLVGALLAATVVAPFASAPVAAADPARQLAAVRGQVDRLANEYFAARQRLDALDAALAHLRSVRARIEREYAKEHRLAVRRAVARYTEGTPIPDDTASALDAAGASVILERAAATTTAAMQHYLRIRSSLLATQRRIAGQRRAQAALVAQLAARTRVVNRQLAAAQRAYREMLAARAAAAARAASASSNARRAASTAAAAVPPVSNTPVSTPAPPAPPGTNPHHNDPFLSCVRQRESHGYYGAVNPGGYYGAYQFAITTWNITASHAGRPSLIGVRPDHASPWDQDDLAWTLYQWQGEAPWGGHCP